MNKITFGFLFCLSLFYSCGKEDTPSTNTNVTGTGSVSNLNCSSTIVTGSLTKGVAANFTASLPYTGGNKGTYSAIKVNSTGVTGLVLESPAGKLDSGSGSIVLTLKGTPNTTGNAVFPISIFGKNCSISIPVSDPITGYFIKFNLNGKDSVLSGSTCQGSSSFNYTTSGFSDLNRYCYIDIEPNDGKNKIEKSNLDSLINKKIALDNCSGCRASASVEIAPSSWQASDLGYKTDEADNVLPDQYLIIKSVTFLNSFTDVFGDKYNNYVITGEFNAKPRKRGGSTIELKNGSFRLIFRSSEL